MDRAWCQIRSIELAQSARSSNWWVLTTIVAFLFTPVGSLADDIRLSVAPSRAEGLEAYAPLPHRLTLPEALKTYRERGYDLLIADAALLTAVGGLQSAGQFANPSIDFTYSHAANSSPPDGYSGTVSDNAAILDTLIIGKRRLRIAVARAALDSQKMTRVDAERGLVSAFKQQWVACVAAMRQLDANREILKSQQDTLHLIENRYRAGGASEVEVSQQKTATYEAAQQVEIATQAYEQAKVGLAFLLGVRGKTPAFDVDLGLFQANFPKEVEEPPEDLHQVAYVHRPDLRAQRFQMQSAEDSIRLTRREIVPDISVIGGYVAAQGSYVLSTWSVGFSMTVPLFYRMKGELTQAQGTLRTQQVTLAKLEAQVLSDVDSAYSAFSAARRRRNRLESGYLEQSKLAADLTRFQYDKGAASLVDFLVAERAYIATVQEHIQSLNDCWIAIYQLEAAVGEEFHP